MTTLQITCPFLPDQEVAALQPLIEEINRLTHSVETVPDIAERARLAVFRMLEVGRQD